ncbi:GM15867 [Drosophila sechellia]|uniref:GM15867 n=1 Tax=Drosophila sechellia TaxID=7238 RepID=B4I7W3_DROSE|nr:GM15867 [Drosophila sechellia]
MSAPAPFDLASSANPGTKIKRVHQRRRRLTNLQHLRLLILGLQLQHQLASSGDIKNEEEQEEDKEEEEAAKNKAQNG